MSFQITFFFEICTKLSVIIISYQFDLIVINNYLISNIIQSCVISNYFFFNMHQLISYHYQFGWIFENTFSSILHLHQTVNTLVSVCFVCFFRNWFLPETLIFPPENQENRPVSMSQSETRSKSRIHVKRDRANVPQKVSV